jgi:hypothetical protein
MILVTAPFFRILLDKRRSSHGKRYGADLR